MTARCVSKANGTIGRWSLSYRSWRPRPGTRGRFPTPHFPIVPRLDANRQSQSGDYDRKAQPFPIVPPLFPALGSRGKNDRKPVTSPFRGDTAFLSFFSPRPSDHERDTHGSPMSHRFLGSWTSPGARLPRGPTTSSITTPSSIPPAPPKAAWCNMTPGEFENFGAQPPPRMTPPGHPRTTSGTDGDELGDHDLRTRPCPVMPAHTSGTSARRR
jgi:hypothetical protein